MRAVYETKSTLSSSDRARARGARAGYRAMKVVIIPYTHYSACCPKCDRTARMMSALRQAVGPEVEIMVDFHGRPASVAAALAYIEALKPGRPMFVEEVLPPGDKHRTERGRRQRQASRSRPANGLSSPPNSRTSFVIATISIAEPDICHCGGLWEAKKIAAMAETAGNRGGSAQSPGSDRRRHGAAFCRFDPQSCDPRGNGGGKALVL